MNTLAEAVSNPAIGPLGQEMAAALQERAESHQQEEGLTPEEAAARVREDLVEREEHVLACPPDQLSWEDLAGLLQRDPQTFQRRCGEIQRAAREELASGHRASRPVEVYGSTPWQRAQFLALRQELADGWQPRNGLERQLVDTMAQAQAAWEHWLKALTARAAREAAAEDALRGGGRQDAERSAERAVGQHALEQAGAMADRFNRVFLRTLRALCGMRKAQLVMVQNANQVNVGQRQVNVTGPSGRAG